MMADHVSYKITDRTATHATIRVEVPAAEAQAVLNTVYSEYSRELRIPGFRKGKVPRNVLNTRFGEDTFVVESRQRMRETHLPAALAELDLRPITRPDITEQDAEAEGAFSFEASFSVLPDVELPDLAGVEAERFSASPVTDDDVSAALDEVQQRFATLAPKEEPIVEIGDVVQVADASGETWSFRTSDADPMLADVIGKRAGETFSLTSPESPEAEPSTETQDADASSDSVEFTVSEVRSVVLPDIDDELAKDAGYESLDNMQSRFREQMDAARLDAASAQTRSALLDATVAGIDLELPPEFVEELVEEERKQLVERLQASRPGVPLAEILTEQDETEESLRERIEAGIKRRVRRELVAHALVEHFQIAISDDDLTKAAEREAELRGENPMRYVARLKAEEHWDSYRNSLEQDQALDQLAEIATLHEAKPDASAVSDADGSSSDETEDEV